MLWNSKELMHPKEGECVYALLSIWTKLKSQKYQTVRDI